MGRYFFYNRPKRRKSQMGGAMALKYLMNNAVLLLMAKQI